MWAARCCRAPLTGRTILEATPQERERARAPVATMARDSKPCCTSPQEANSSLLELSQAAVVSQGHALGREYRNTTTLCFILASVRELKSQLCLLTHPERTSAA